MTITHGLNINLRGEKSIYWKFSQAASRVLTKSRESRCPVISLRRSLHFESEPDVRRTYIATGKKQATNSRVDAFDSVGARKSRNRWIRATRPGPEICSVSKTTLPNGHKFRHVGPSTLGWPSCRELRRERLASRDDGVKKRRRRRRAREKEWEREGGGE